MRSCGQIAYKMERSALISCYMLEWVLKIINKVTKKKQQKNSAPEAKY